MLKIFPILITFQLVRCSNSYYDENSNTAELYDKIYNFKNTQHLPQEIVLIESLVQPNAKILDIGCGTGRHAIPLHQKSYKILGFDYSEAMLKQLKKKNPDIGIVQGDFLVWEGSGKFDLAICFWNAICEICKSEIELKKFFEVVNKALNKDGKLLLNFDNLSTLDVENFDYTDSFVEDEKKYVVHWKVISFDQGKAISKSKETIEIIDQTTGHKEVLESTITQKWWSKDKVTEIALEYGYTISEYKLDNIDECYLILEKITN